MRRLLVFCTVGGAGFVIDAGIVQALTRQAEWNPYYARVVSFIVAATFTWASNRAFTFHVRHRPTINEWLGYTGLMVAGAIVNYAAFALTLATWPWTHLWPAAGVAVGSIAGMMVNYLGMRWWFGRIESSAQH